MEKDETLCQIQLCTYAHNRKAFTTNSDNVLTRDLIQSKEKRL